MPTSTYISRQPFSADERIADDPFRIEVFLLRVVDDDIPLAQCVENRGAALTNVARFQDVHSNLSTVLLQPRTQSTMSSDTYVDIAYRRGGVGLLRFEFESYAVKRDGRRRPNGIGGCDPHAVGSGQAELASLTAGTTVHN